VGFDLNWGSKIIASQADEDVPSDDELIKRAKNYCLNQLIETTREIMVEKKMYGEINNIQYLRRK
jgi:hypothetical protein